MAVEDTSNPPINPKLICYTNATKCGTSSFSGVDTTKPTVNKPSGNVPS